jgi:hypothetical protein
MNLRLRGGALALALTACVAAACGDDGDGDDDDDGGSFGTYSASDYCDETCDCVGCSQSEREDCIDLVDDYLDDARDSGCDSEANGFMACLDEEGTCRDGDFDNDGCEQESSALGTCVQGGQSGAGGGGP